ncbi:hypothetical protein EMCRGX_G006138 [Ephydatia muelleri]
MELDTGAAVSIMPYTMYKEKMAHIQLRKSTVNLKTYTGQRVRPLGQITVQVAKNGTVESLKLVVVDGLGPPLMGRNWLSRIPIDWGEIKVLRAGDEKQSRTLRLKRLLEKYPGIQKEQGTLKGTKAIYPHLPGVTCLRTRVEKELERLEKGGIIAPVSTSEWATPVVVAPKKDGSIRLCRDFRMTVNQAIKVDKYPLPLTVSTHKGLYRYNRLPFGVSLAPALWQRTMELIQQGIPKTQCLLDDIIVAGSNEEEHFHILEQVLERLERHNLAINMDKCAFFQTSLEFCGHRIDADGLHKTQAKMRAITEAPVPRDVSQLRAFLGLVNYYNWFLPNLANTLAPLHRLLQKNTMQVPLVSILHPDKALPSVTAARLQRYALVLSEYTFHIRYRSTHCHGNADALSCLSLTEATEVERQDREELDDCPEIRLNQLEQIPVTTAVLRDATAKDPVLSRVLEYIQVLDEIHGGHLGVVKMKALARGHVWWPRIDQDIEFSIKNCDGCRQVKHDPKLTPVHPWEFPEGPWRRVHIYFAGSIEGKQFLVAVDAYSTSTEKTLDELRAMFARWGIPQQIVSDNGPQFTSDKFEQFVRTNN